MERIVVAFPGEEPRRRVLRLLESGGFSCAARCTSGGEVIRTVRNLGRAAVICGFQFRDMTASNLAARLEDRAALLVLASAARLDLCEGENLVKLPLPATRAEFFASVETLCRREPLRPCRPPIQRSQEEQQLIRRAKELLMEVNRMSEAEAYRFLQKYSMDTGRKLVETARLFLDRYTN